MKKKILSSIVLFSATGILIPFAFADSPSNTYLNSVTAGQADDNVTTSPLPHPADNEIDYENAKPMPLPSIDAPINSKVIPDHKDLDSPETSLGQEGTGKANPERLINPIKIESKDSE